MAEPALANHRHDTASADRSWSRPPMLGDPAFNTVYRRAKDFARHVVAQVSTANSEREAV